MIKNAVAYFFDILQTIVLAAAMFVIVYLFIAQPHIVKGASMEPNFFTGDYILTEKVSYRFKDPQRGDIIVFEAPDRPNSDYIKRVIALPGESFKIEKGSIYINGQLLKEKYEPNNTSSGQYIKEGQEMIVPDNTYIVLGDNRPHSSDSRKFGPISEDSIVGRAAIRYWPLNRSSRLTHIKYQ